MKYKEIFKLKEMLEKAKIPFEFANTNPLGIDASWAERLQIGYPVLPPDNGNVCSVIEGIDTYGQEQDLLEIMGLLTPEEHEHDSVKGYLIAEDVFERIKTHYSEVCKK